MPEQRKTFIRDETFAGLAALGILGCQWWIMDDLRVPSKWVVWTLAALLLVGVVGFRLLPRTYPGAVRMLQLGFVWVLIAANVIDLIALGGQALFGQPSAATELLLSGTVLWVMNVLVFGLAYWVTDAGGPDERAAREPVVGDWAFPQQTDGTGTSAGWIPLFADYLYLGFTGAIAFGPTDAMPYTPRAKAMMTIEGALALATIGVIIARAVSLASG